MPVGQPAGFFGLMERVGAFTKSKWRDSELPPELQLSPTYVSRESLDMKPLTVALIGNPNTGKSTLFNALSGLQTRVANYPGVTVEKKVGRLRWGEQWVELIDLPGTYSLSPRSPDEMVVVDVLLGHQRQTPPPDVVLVIADASNLERHGYLLSQVLDLGRPCVLVLNMMDVARRRGIRIDHKQLEQRLGIPVVLTEAHRGVGLDQLPGAVMRALQSPPPSVRLPWAEPFLQAVDALAERWKRTQGSVPERFLLERMLLDVSGEVEQRFADQASFDLPTFLAELRQSLRQQGVRIPAIEAQTRYAWISQCLQGVYHRPQEQGLTWTDRADHILTHRFVGLLVFAALMFLVFQAIYQWAEPLMGLIEAAQGLVANAVAAQLSPGPLRSLLVDGVIAGVGAVLVFLPQIALLFLFIGIFEDCGYMARAAFVMDRLMCQVGLSGKSFVPLMSSFACAIPGIMATRVIENPRDRLVTILVAPLMSCSARLPVYLLLIGAFVPDQHFLWGRLSLRGLVLFAMMSVGAVVAVPVAWLLKKIWFRGQTPPFVMELPSYKWPSWRTVLARVYERSYAFVRRAGTLIFATTVLVWAAGYFPSDRSALDAITAELESHPESSLARDSLGQPTPQIEERERLIEERNRLAAEAIAQSFLGTAGRAMEPLFRPLGWDWRIGMAVLASFPAREVVIATLGTVFSLGGEDDVALADALRAAQWPDGRPVFNLAVALSIMVFFALCAQCASTLVVIRRETNSWRWPTVTFVYMTTLAYVGALLVFQVASRLGAA